MFPIFVTILISSNLLSVSTDLLKPVDLSWDFDKNTIYWIGVQPFVFTKIIAQIQNKTDWYAANEFCAGEHGGTHLDAPYHFYKKGMKVGEIPLQKLIAHGVVIDISDEVLNSNPLVNLEPRHLTKWQEENGNFSDNTVLLVKTGWSKYYHNKRKYFGLSDDNSTLNFPGISAEAAQCLIDTGRIVGVGIDVPSVDEGKSTYYPTHRLLTARNIYLLENVKLLEELPGISSGAAKWLAKRECVVGVGIDTSSVDPGNITDFPTHRILTSYNKYLLENVKLLHYLPARNFTLLVMPMYIKEGTGGPLRLVPLLNYATEENRHVIPYFLMPIETTRDNIPLRLAILNYIQL